VPVDLSTPLDWKNATGDAAAMLEKVQANILRPHVREHLSVLFLHFGDPAEGRTFLHALAPTVKSAKQHLDEVEAFHTSGAAGSTYVGVGVSAGGYAALNVSAGVPTDASFTRGMKAPATRTDLHDPPVSTWEAPYREDIHAVVLVGDATEGGMSAGRNAVLDLITDAITVVGEETGLGRHNSNGDGIEHFGYVDGRSQPLFLTQDIVDEAADAAGVTGPAGLKWDPAFPLNRVLVPDTAAPNPDVDFGSYFVFRKLEQNVRRFKQAEQDLADQLGLIGDDRERAGAMLIGRFEDGTPLTVQRTADEALPVSNNFSYKQDTNGLKCPFHGHIRKSNPRGSGGFETPEKERKHIMARRGQTYGQRADDPDAEVPPSARPTGGVGLLFMAFNVDIGQQADFVQKVWVNNPGFPKVPPGAPKPPGLDQVIGQGTRAPLSQPKIWDATAAIDVDPAPQAVTLKGGEYFFMPSLDFLNAILTV
jgi:Dyp-type peroxidase family